MKRIHLRLSLAACLILTISALPYLSANAQAAYILNINFNSQASGSVSISTDNSTCSSNCSKTIAADTSVTLTSSSNSDSRFVYWGGGGIGDVSCNQGSSSGTCTFTMTKDLETRPYWEFKSVNINVSKIGTGSGTVSGNGISCGGDCSTSITTQPYPASNGNLSLTATAAAGSTFAGWDTSGNACYLGGGKSGDPTINPSPTCSVYIPSTIKTTTAVAIFNSTGSSSNNSSSSTNSSTGTSGSSSSTNAAASKPIAAPSANSEAIKSLSDMTINGKKIDTTKNEKKEFSSDKPIVLSGKTIPNGVVTLYVYSKPKKYTVTADSNGLWSIEVAGLPTGNHHAEIEVTDSATNTTSQRTKLLEFAVKSASDQAATASTTAVKTNSSKLGLLIGAVVTSLVLLSAGALLALRQFKPELFNSLKSSITSRFHKTPPSPPLAL